jgi:hypothetical protein
VCCICFILMHEWEAHEQGILLFISPHCVHDFNFFYFYYSTIANEYLFMLERFRNDFIRLDCYEQMQQYGKMQQDFSFAFLLHSLLISYSAFLRVSLSCFSLYSSSFFLKFILFASSCCCLHSFTRQRNCEGIFRKFNFVAHKKRFPPIIRYVFIFRLAIHTFIDRMVWYWCCVYSQQNHQNVNWNRHFEHIQDYSIFSFIFLFSLSLSYCRFMWVVCVLILLFPFSFLFFSLAQIIFIIMLHSKAAAATKQ